MLTMDKVPVQYYSLISLVVELRIHYWTAVTLLIQLSLHILMMLAYSAIHLVHYILCINHFFGTDNCTHGDLRLANGTQYEGRLEVCLNGLWGTITDDFWSQYEARVACGQLGFSNKCKYLYCPN